LLLSKKVDVVLDPVFLLSEADWRFLAEQDVGYKHHGGGHYLLDYSAHAGVLEEFLAIPGAKEEFKIVKKFGTNLNPRDFLSRAVQAYPSVGPSEFIQAMCEAKFIHTTSFHGTVLAIIFRKKFIVRLSGSQGRDSRIIDLLNTFDLSDRIYSK